MARVFRMVVCATLASALYMVTGCAQKTSPPPVDKAQQQKNMDSMKGQMGGMMKEMKAKMPAEDKDKADKDKGAAPKDTKDAKGGKDGKDDKK